MTQPLRILILEDRDADVELLLRELRRFGYEPQWRQVQTEEDYLAGLDPALDVILSDYNLPQFGAPHALQLLQQRGLDTPFIVVSGSIGEEVAVAALKQGATDLLLKDRLWRLGPAVKSALEQKQLRGQKRHAEEQLRQVNAELEQRVRVRTAQLERANEVLRGAIAERTRLEEKFRLTVESAPNAIVMVNRQGQIVLVNAQTEKLFGYSRQELLGQPVELLVPERFRDRHPAHRLAFFARPEALVIGAGRDLYGRRKDGSEFPVEIGLNPIQTEDELLILSAIVDITARKRVEAQILQLNAELEQRVLERTAQLEAANTELARSNVELQRFAYAASHDLQEPLRMVTSYLDLLARRYLGQHDAKADKFIGYAVDGAKRMQGLIEDLLAYSRVESRGVACQPTDTSALLDEVLADLHSTIQATGAVVTQDPLPVVVADPTQLRQVFQNLIGNALKFCEDRPRVHVSAERDGAAWTFCVRDNGIGIAPEHAERIFVLFQRLHTRTKYPGTGIGLAICKKVVERHGGRIWVESQPGQGSVFRFTLPAHDSPPCVLHGASGAVTSMHGRSCVHDGSH